MKCEIIRDLFPSYIDGLTSEESNVAIEEHLRECKECQRYLEAMKKEMVSESYVEKSKAEIQEDINPFKKLKKETRKKIIIAVFAALFTVGILGCIYESLYGHGVQASVDDVEITYEKIGEEVRLGFQPTDDSYTIGLWGGSYSLDENGNEVYEWNKIQPVKWRISPLQFQMPSSQRIYWELIFVDDDTIIDQNGQTIELTGEELLEIEFAGETKKVKITDLRTEEGIKDLK